MNRLLIYFPIILVFGILAIVMSLLYLLRKYQQVKGYRSPFTDKFFRSPGESLNRQIAKINDEIIKHLVWMITIPLMLYAYYISLLHSGTSKFSTSASKVFFIAGIVFIAYCLFKLIKFLKLRRSYRLGYEGEIAVGQELNHLMRDGYFVYHDFPAGNFNIDHIVVGSPGVFAVETKARSKGVHYQFVNSYPRLFWFQVSGIS